MADIWPANAEPDRDMQHEFLPARLAIRIRCGAQRAALEAELVALMQQCQAAALAFEGSGEVVE